jgi:hypothetical protein
MASIGRRQPQFKIQPVQDVVAGPGLALLAGEPTTAVHGTLHGCSPETDGSRKLTRSLGDEGGFGKEMRNRDRPDWSSRAGTFDGE